MHPRSPSISWNGDAHSSSGSCRRAATRLSALDADNRSPPPKKKQQQGKKRRFLQLAHPDAPIAAADANEGGGSGRSDSVAKASVATSEAPRRGPPLRTGKSIEDLESILESRWGTAGGGSVAKKGKGGDEDFVLSFESEGDEYEMEEMPRSGAGGGVFRSKRVVDPWAEEEGVYEKKVRNGRSSDEVEEPYSGKAKRMEKKRTFDRDGAMFDRVRANQDRLRKEREEKARATYGDGKKKGKKAATKADGDQALSVPVDVTRDYYDEDDEGYEEKQWGNGNDSDGRGKGYGGGLVSPRPAGGQGSTYEEKPDSSSLSGGIFKERRKPVIDLGMDPKSAKKKGRHVAREVDETKQPKKPKRQREPILPTLLDDNGNELFLTLEQAERNVQSLISATLEKKNDEDGEDGATAVPTPSLEWEDLGIVHPGLLDNLRSKKMGCYAPLPVQDKTCPPAVEGNDVLVSTHTGSGKTLAFLTPIAQRLLLEGKGRGQNPRALIVAPGRELASQIVSVARDLFEGTGLKAGLAIGGTPFNRNVDAIRKIKPDIIVGTPGRIAELVVGRPGEKSGRMKISGLQTLILDEFDALLQYKAHKEPTIAILNALDRQHKDSLQRILCSATASDMMGGEKLDDYLRPGYAHASVDEDDVLVTSGEGGSGEKGEGASITRVSRTTIHGSLHVAHQRLALEALRKVLYTNPQPQQVLIFVDNSRRVGVVIDKLANMDIVAAPLHGGSGSEKGDRAEVNKALREGYVGIVVATEMAARGIDAPYLTHVINLDLPTDGSHYAHRAGRVGRGGRPGVVVNITSNHREKGVPRRFAEELGIEMHAVETRDAKLRIVQDSKSDVTEKK